MLKRNHISGHPAYLVRQRARALLATLPGIVCTLPGACAIAGGIHRHMHPHTHAAYAASKRGR